MSNKKFTPVEEELIAAGYPPQLFMTMEERKAAWEANPTRPMPAFGNAPKPQDPAAQQLLEELEVKKKTKAKNRIQKMLDRQVDRTGQRWDPCKNKWVVDDTQAKVEQALISITTNTRGATKMKDYAEMSLTELVAAYNKASGKEPIKKFKDKATGLKRMAEIQSAKTAAATVKSVAASTASKLSDVVRKPKPAPKEGSANKLAAEFNARVGSFREKLLIALDDHYKKMVPELDLLKAVYGSKNLENAGALTMVIKGAQTTIEKNKLPYTLKKEKNEAKEVSYGLFPK